MFAILLSTKSAICCNELFNNNLFSFSLSFLRTLVVFCHPTALGLPTLHNPIQNHHYSPSDKSRYLSSLPEPNTHLLQQMKLRYPDSYDSLPLPVLSPHRWKLYVKFCHFSGLPIAEGEMHYRVKSNISAFADNSCNGTCNEETKRREEISLSQEVMEAVNGQESAEILRLPNQKTFEYLRLQYAQQSDKLREEVFDRKSWEMVMPEI